MKTWEKVAIGVGIIAIAYFVMKDSDKDKYDYQRKKSSDPSSKYEPWKKTGSRS